MDLTKIPLFEAMTKRMSWLNQRQSVLADNVANANTPGYVPKDLKEPDFGALVKAQSGHLTLATDQSGQIATGGKSGNGFVTQAMGTERGLDGNGVSLDAQMLDVSENAADYSLMTTLYRAHVSLINTALDRSGS